LTIHCLILFADCINQRYGDSYEHKTLMSTLGKCRDAKLTVKLLILYTFIHVFFLLMACIIKLYLYSGNSLIAECMNVRVDLSGILSKIMSVGSCVDPAGILPRS